MFALTTWDTTTGDTVTYVTGDDCTKTLATISFHYAPINAAASVPPPRRGPIFIDASRVAVSRRHPASVCRERKPPRAPHMALRHARRRDPLVLR